MDDFFSSRKKFKTDSLTGLYDREVVVEYANHLISKNIPFSLALVDIDNFKNVNDSYGHTAGDTIIKLFSEKLKEEIGEQGVVGRFGGDEFIFVTKEIVEYDAIWTFCRTLFKKIDGLTVQEIPTCFITCTTGLSRFPLDGKSYDVLMEKTDKALYRGKQKGRSCFIIYLDAKHKDIVLHKEGDKSASTMQRITTMYKLLNMQNSLAEGIKAVLNNFTSTIMTDHIAIQSKDKLLFSTVHPLSPAKEFSFINDSLFESDISGTNGLFYINDRQQLKVLKQDKLYDAIFSQQIKASVFATIKYNDKVYGFIRADSVTHSRIWQHDDLELFVVAANAIAAALHYQNLELDDLTN